MKLKITPAAVAAQFDWDLNAIAEFCSDTLEDANGHGVAAALSAVGIGEYDLACEFLQIEKEHVEAGHLTGELYKRRSDLMERLIKAKEGA